MSIALKHTADGRLQQLQIGDSIEADSLERRNSSGNLVVGSTLIATEELRLGSTTALVRSMGDAQVDGILLVTDSAGDTSELLDLDQTGTNAGRSVIRVGGRTPEGNVTGNAGDLYFRDGGGSSTVYVHRGTDATNTGWLDLLSGPHSGLTGLTADDHTQYALLAGRSGGQTLIGGTASGNDLTLTSTSHATKGSIILAAGTNLDASNEDIIDVKTVSFDSEIDDGNETGTYALDWTTGQRHKATLTGNITTLTLTAPAGPCNLMMKIVQDATGGRTITWPSSVKWPGGGTAPVLSSAASAVDLISFYYDGTDYHGAGGFDFQ